MRLYQLREFINIANRPARADNWPSKDRGVDPGPSSTMLTGPPTACSAGTASVRRDVPSIRSTAAATASSLEVWNEVRGSSDNPGIDVVDYAEATENVSNCLKIGGGRRRDRTSDLSLVRAALSQLS